MKKRLLLVEDNESLLELVTAIISRRGYEVAEAKTANEALRLIEESPFDVVISDLVLEGLPGVELIRKVRASNPNTRIVAISGKGPLFLEEAVKMGADVAVSKPFKINQIVDAVEGT